MAAWSSLRLSAETSNLRAKTWHHYHLSSQTGLGIGSQAGGLTSLLSALLCRGEAGLLHRCEQREPEQQGRDDSHSYLSLPSQCVSHSAATFSGINIPETPKCQWQAQCLSKKTIPPCREINIWLIYSSLIQFYFKNATANVKQVLTFNTTLLKYSEGFLFLLDNSLTFSANEILPSSLQYFQILGSGLREM